jgi:choline-sulfatase
MPADRPNVLLLMSDAHAYRHVSHRYPEGPATPALDGLADSGTVVDQTYCQVPLCTPSRLCLLTGREAHRCGAWENWDRLQSGLPTLPGVFSDAGYETCLTGKMHIGGDRQFFGFDHRPYGDLTGSAGHQVDPPEPYWNHEDVDLGGSLGVSEIPESMLQERNLSRESVSFIREQEHTDPDQPWFVCASFSRPHGPHTAPRRHVEAHPYAEIDPPAVDHTANDDHPQMRGGWTDEETVLRRRAGYFACVSFLDEIIGDMLGQLQRGGHLENTVVMYTSDHGEMAGNHGAFAKRHWYENSARVPWVVERPEQRAGECPSNRMTTPASLGDLFPTLCGLCGVEAPDGLDGVDLSASLETGTEPDRGPVVCDDFNTGGLGEEWRMVRDGRYKYVRFRDSPELLIDLETDPTEEVNLAADAGGEGEDEAAAALERLRGLVEETVDFEAIEARREQDQEDAADHQLGIGGTAGLRNAYHLPDGRVVDADAPLYSPDVWVEEPEHVYSDAPE